MSGTPFLSRYVVFLNGPIGSGKTTLGRSLAHNLDGQFFDSDDFGNPAKPWYGKIRTVCSTLVEASIKALRQRSVVVVAMPLRRRDWCYFRETFRSQGVTALCVTLSARLEDILNPKRGRVFSAREQARIATMIAEGYASRPFSDLIVDSSRDDFGATAANLAAQCRQLIAGRIPHM